MALNKWIGMGRVANDLELKQTQSGKSVTSFSLAVDRNFSNPDGERETDFITIVAWGKTADFVLKYFTKGQMMAVEGALHIRPWTDKNGNKRKSAEVMADRVYFCGGKRDSEHSGNNGDSPSYQTTEQPVPNDDFALIEDDEGDLPF